MAKIIANMKIDNRAVHKDRGQRWAVISASETRFSLIQSFEYYAASG